MQSKCYQGFTLIELSIVLVIIGLIVGGILTGRDLIRTAAERAQITQIEQYNTATNTFKGKYGGLPGDISATLVTQLGFTVTPTRAGSQGQGDGNGILEGYGFAGAGVVNVCCTAGETAWFWEDLTSNAPGLIEGSYSFAGTTSFTSGIYPTSKPIALSAVIPAAKLAPGLYVNVYTLNNTNYFGVSAVTQLDGNGAVYGNPGMTVLDAYKIDAKVDDGFPQTGRVTAMYQAWNVRGNIVWAAGPGTMGPTDTSATNGSPTTCYDNGGSGGTKQQYSLEQNNGMGVNCALSFQFQ